MVNSDSVRFSSESTVSSSTIELEATHPCQSGVVGID